MTATRSTRAPESGKRNLGPLQRVHLVVTYDQLPMQVRPGHPAGGALVAQDLTGGDVGAHLHQDLRLVPIARVYPPPMVDDRGIPAHDQLAREHDHARGGGRDWPVLAARQNATDRETIRLCP